MSELNTPCDVLFDIEDAIKKENDTELDKSKEDTTNKTGYIYEAERDYEYMSPLLLNISIHDIEDRIESYIKNLENILHLPISEVSKDDNTIACAIDIELTVLMSIYNYLNSRHLDINNFTSESRKIDISLSLYLELKNFLDRYFLKYKNIYHYLLVVKNGYDCSVTLRKEALHFIEEVYFNNNDDNLFDARTPESIKYIDSYYIFKIVNDIPYDVYTKLKYNV